MQRMDVLFKTLEQDQKDELIYCLNKRIAKWFPCGDDEFVGVYVNETEKLKVTQRLHGWCNGVIKKENEDGTKTKHETGAETLNTESSESVAPERESTGITGRGSDESGPRVGRDLPDSDYPTELSLSS